MTVPTLYFSISGEKHGYNIPEVTAAPHVANWLSEDGVKLLNNCRDDKMLPDFAKLMICRNTIINENFSKISQHFVIPSNCSVN